MSRDGLPWHVKREKKGAHYVFYTLPFYAGWSLEPCGSSYVCYLDCLLSIKEMLEIGSRPPQFDAPYSFPTEIFGTPINPFCFCISQALRCMTGNLYRVSVLPNAVTVPEDPLKWKESVKTKKGTALGSMWEWYKKTVCLTVTALRVGLNSSPIG